jgi:two-component system sensor histidine kinase RpfC
MAWWHSLTVLDKASLEIQQASARLIIGVLGLGVILSLMAVGQVPDPSRLLSLWIAYALGAYLLLIMVTYSPADSPSRRLLGLLADTAIIAGLLHDTPALLAPLYIIYLGVELDYGFRYGQLYLFIAMVVTVAALGVVIVTTPFWAAGTTFSLGLLLGLILLPFYIATQLARISRTQSTLDQANQLRTEFMANLSHGLRTPVNTIVGLSYLLQDLEVTGDHRLYLETLRMAAKELAKEADQALHWFRLEAGSVALFNESFDLYRVVTECVHILRPQADAKGLPLQLRIDPQVPYYVAGDSYKLSQILMNLVSNAIKFTQHGGVEIRLTSLEQGAEQATLCLTVKDTGIGIPEARKRAILEPYCQADAATARDYGGSGLGTAIARRTVEAMGGELWFQSVQHQGTIFWVKLPFQVLPAPDPHLRVQPLTVLAIARDRGQDWLLQLRSGVERLAIVPTLPPPALDDYDLVFIEASADVNQALRSFSTPALTAAPPVYVVVTPDAGPLADTNPGITIDYPQESAVLYRALHARALWKQVFFTPPADATPVPVHAARILVAEDNAPHQLILRRLLEQAGYQVTVVDNGRDALAALRTATYDLALFDTQMPHLGGLEALQCYHAETREASIPIIIMSADIAPESTRRCEQAGAAHYLTKPLKPEMLLWVVAHTLEQTVTVDDRNPKPIQAQSPPSGDPARAASILDNPYLHELQAHKSPQFLAALIASVQRASEHALADLEHARTTQDPAACRLALHALANAAAAVGAEAVYRRCHAATRASEHALLAPDASNWLEPIQQAQHALRTALENAASQH